MDFRTDSGLLIGRKSLVLSSKAIIPYLHRPCAVLGRSGRYEGRRRTTALADEHRITLRHVLSAQTATHASLRADVTTSARPQTVGPAETPPVPNALTTARSLFAALNRRDVSAVLGLLDADVSYENLGSAAALRGRADVGRFYLESLAGLPEDAVFVLEGLEGQEEEEQEEARLEQRHGPVLQAGVAWHLELHGVPVPLSRGVGLYVAHPATGLLVRIVDSPEHALKLPGPLLTLAGAAWGSPLVMRGLGPLVLPAARGVTSLLENFAPGSSSGGGGGGISESHAGGLPASSAGGSGSGVSSLADSFAAVLNTMLPFSGVPAAGAGAISRGGGGGGGRMMYRDHAWPGAAGNGAATASAGGSGAGASSWAAGGSTSAGRAGPSSPASPAAAAAAAPPAPAPASASSPSPVTPRAVTGTIATAPGQASSPPGPSGASLGDSGNGIGAAQGVVAASAASSRGQPIPMRPLPQPDPAGLHPSPTGNPSASAASASSFDDASTGIRSSSGSTAVSAVAAGARPASVAVGAAATGSQASAGSMDETGPPSPGPTSAPGGAAAAWTLPFTPSSDPDVNLTALWEKDAEASQVQEYEAMLDVLQLGGLQKVTARLIDGLDLRQDAERFEVGFVTVVPFFRVTEKSRFGQKTTMTRRDLRDPISGRQTSVATRVPGGVVVDLSWGAPLAGSLREEYVLSQDGGQLAVTSSIRIGAREATATQVYRRSSRNKSDFLTSQRSVYGSMQDVLETQEKKYGKINY